MRTSRSGRSVTSAVHLGRTRRGAFGIVALFATPFVAMVCVVSGCNMLGNSKSSACERDEAQCPTSERLSTDVACDCRCVAGYSGLTPTREFEGTISACLPAELNAKLATADQLAALDAMPSDTFNQRVFKFCSNDVAKFLDDLIEEQQRPPDLESMCMGPRIQCSCGTSGAQGVTDTCSQPCADTECTKESCIPLLKVGGSVDTSGCGCSRVNACNGMTPAEGESPICLNRPAAVLRRRAAAAAKAAASAEEASEPAPN